MEKFIRKVSKERALTMNSIVLAFVGDAVYTLFVREKLALASDDKANELHRRASDEVRAQAQAELIDGIFERLTDIEKDVFRRARNTKKGTKAKSASVAEYNKSTGFEAVLGYLYLTGDLERIEELLNC